MFQWWSDHPLHLFSPPWSERKAIWKGKIAPSLGDENLPWLLTTYPSPGMMLQECYKIQCIQVVGSCEEIATLLMDYDANHHPVVRPHEGLSIGGDP